MNTLTREELNDVGKELDAETTSRGRTTIFCCLINKTGTDNEISFMIDDRRDKLIYIRNVMLTVGVELDGDIIIHFVGVFVASLDGSANTKIGEKSNMIVMIGFEYLFG